MKLRRQVYIFLSSSHGKEFRRRVEEETHSWAVLGLQAKRNRAGMRDSHEKKKTINKHVLREHRSGFVGDSMFPQGTGWDAFGFGVNDWDHLDVELYMLSGLLKIYTSPSLVNFPSHFNKKITVSYSRFSIYKGSHQVSFQKRSDLRSAKQDMFCH